VHVAEPERVGTIRLVETGEANLRAVTQVNPIRPRDAKAKVASLPKTMKPDTERDKLTETTNSRQCHKPIPKLIDELNRHLTGWADYFKFGYPRDAFREINWHVAQRLFRHLNRRSQRAFRLPEGSTYYRYFRRLGLKPLEI
jgi:hypothetical protein